MKLRFATFAIAAVIAGCSTTQQDLKQNASVSRAIDFKENYQEIYRRVYTNARECMHGGMFMSHASINVDGQLYNELGYGEISIYLDNVLKNYYATARIEKSGTGAKMIVHAGNSLGSDRTAQQLIDWANGMPCS